MRLFVNVEVTKMLFNAGANVTATDNNGRTALHLAIEKRSTKSWWDADDIDVVSRLLLTLELLVLRRNNKANDTKNETKNQENDEAINKKIESAEIFKCGIF